VLKPIGIFSIASIRRPPGRLNISNIPRLGSQDAKKCGWIKGSCSYFNIVGLLKDTVMVSPKLLEG